MAKTLDQLMAECGLSTSSSPKEQEKIASAVVSSEIDQVLEGLGLNSTAAEEESLQKVANETGNTGGNMGLQSIYEEMFGSEEHIEKVASEATYETYTAEGEDSAENIFGQMVAHYFNVGHDAFFEKIAEDSQPLAGLPSGGQLTGVIGQARDPHLPVNMKSEAGAPQYSLASAGPAIKAVLKRKISAEAGEVGGYHQG